jgi:DNA-binding FadR family transcriptional regulator
MASPVRGSEMPAQRKTGPAHKTGSWFKEIMAGSSRRDRNDYFRVTAYGFKARIDRACQTRTAHEAPQACRAMIRNVDI